MPELALLALLYSLRMPTDPPAPMGHEQSPSYRGLLTERIARQLEHDIRSGDIAPGAKLPSEREFAVQFGASRNVVREVLRRLEAQHLIEVAPGRGSFVREQSSVQARSYDALHAAAGRVPLLGHELAARPCDHGRHRGGGHRVEGRQGYRRPPASWRGAGARSEAR